MKLSKYIMITILFTIIIEPPGPVGEGHVKEDIQIHRKPVE